MRVELLAGRAYMVRALRDPPGRTRAPAGYRLRPLEPTRLDELAALQWTAYQRTPDQRLYPQLLGSPSACEDHLRSLLEAERPFRFQAQASLMMVQGKAVVGFIIVSQGPDGTASVDNLAVHPEHRGGTGRVLLMEALRRLQEAGATAASLTVTCANLSALQLYRKCGFMECVRLPVAVRRMSPRRR